MRTAPIRWQPVKHTPAPRLTRIPEPEETNPTMLLFLKLYLRKFTVTATAGEGGTITPEGETSYHYSSHRSDFRKGSRIT